MIVVVVVIVLIAIPVILAIMWLGVFVSVIEEETEKVTFNMASPDVTERMIADQTYFDAELEINKVIPDLAIVTYTELRVIVKASDGSVLIQSTKPTLDDPSDYDDGLDGTVDVQVWYDSLTSGIITVAGDSFKLTGMTDDYEGATVQITRDGRIVGSVVLPTDLGG